MISDRQPNADRPVDGGHTELLVDAGWIAEHHDDRDVRLVEVDVTPAAYDAGHIPGAVLWNAYTDLRHRDYSPINAAELASLLASSGISPNDTIVFYGYGAYLGFWLMRRARHSRLMLMDGPRGRWASTGHRWSRAEPDAARGSYAVPTDDPRLVSTQEQVASRIGRPGAVLLDVRSRAEFTGEHFWPSGAAEDAGRAGHIPGATHLPFELMRTEDGILRSPDELRAVFAANGVEADRPVITYCTIGNRASLVWFVLTQLLGYPRVSVYYGSWVEWGRLATTPIET